MLRPSMISIVCLMSLVVFGDMGCQLSKEWVIEEDTKEKKVTIRNLAEIPFRQSVSHV